MTRCILLATCALLASAVSANEPVELGSRPLMLVEDMDEGPLKQALRQCAGRRPEATPFSIGHRGAPLKFPEHTRESYEAAARMGAGVLECDVTFTRDRQLVCRHSQCDLHTTTDILAVPELAAKCTQPFKPADPVTGAPAAAQCCTSDLTMAEFLTLHGKRDAFDSTATTVAQYMGAGAAGEADRATLGTLLSHAQSIELFRALGVKFAPELKAAQVPMPYEGEFTQEGYAQQLIDEYTRARVPARDVFVQSFNLGDVLYWLAKEPAYGRQALYLDDRVDREGGIELAVREMPELTRRGVRIIAPPIWALIGLDGAGNIVASEYARAARAAGLDIVAWTLERSGSLVNAKGPPPTYYYRSVASAIDNDGDVYTVLDVLAKQVGARAVFSDWPATVTYYANCMGLD
jgi:glycerophosphoryl diester phosphodiesterase